MQGVQGTSDGIPRFISSPPGKGLWWAGGYLLLAIAGAGIGLICVGDLGLVGHGQYSVLNTIATTAGTALIIAAVAAATVEQLFFRRVSSMVAAAVAHIERSAKSLYAEKFFVDKYGQRSWDIIRPNIVQVQDRMVCVDFDCRMDLAPALGGGIDLVVDRTYEVFNESKDMQPYTAQHYSTASLSKPRLMVLYVGGREVDRAGENTGKRVTLKEGMYKLGVQHTINVPGLSTCEVRVVQSEPTRNRDNKAMVPILPTERFRLSIRYPVGYEVTFQYVEKMNAVEYDPVETPPGTLSRRLEASNVFPNAAFTVQWRHPGDEAADQALKTPDPANPVVAEASSRENKN